MTRRDCLRLSSDEYRVAFAGERFGSIYMVEAEQVVWVGHIVEYVIWLIVYMSLCHAKREGARLVDYGGGLPSSRYAGFA